MVTILQALRSINAYPLSEAQLYTIAVTRGISLNDEATADVLNSSAYLRATADVYKILSVAPNLSQGGISFSFSAEERKYFRKRACSILSSLGEDVSDVSNGTYGYMGEDFV